MSDGEATTMAVLAWIVAELTQKYGVSMQRFGEVVRLAKKMQHKPRGASVKGLRSKAGYARAAALSPERRTEIARKAALTRWGQ